MFFQQGLKIHPVLLQVSASVVQWPSTEPCRGLNLGSNPSRGVFHVCEGFEHAVTEVPALASAVALQESLPRRVPRV